MCTSVVSKPIYGVVCALFLKNMNLEFTRVFMQWLRFMTRSPWNPSKNHAYNFKNALTSARIREGFNHNFSRLTWEIQIGNWQLLCSSESHSHRTKCRWRIDNILEQKNQNNQLFFSTFVNNLDKNLHFSTTIKMDKLHLRANLFLLIFDWVIAGN